MQIFFCKRLFRDYPWSSLNHDVLDDQCILYALCYFMITIFASCTTICEKAVNLVERNSYLRNTITPKNWKTEILPHFGSSSDANTLVENALIVFYLFRSISYWKFETGYYVQTFGTTINAISMTFNVSSPMKRISKDREEFPWQHITNLPDIKLDFGQNNCWVGNSFCLVYIS